MSLDSAMARLISARHVCISCLAHKFLDTCKVQLITTASKIQNFKPTDPIMTVPKSETYRGWLGSEILLKVCEIMNDMAVLIKKSILFLDVISTLISLSHHLAKYKDPFQ